MNPVERVRRRPGPPRAALEMTPTNQFDGEVARTDACCAKQDSRNSSFFGVSLSCCSSLLQWMGPFSPSGKNSPLDAFAAP